MLAECDRNLLWWQGGDIEKTERGITPAGPWANWQKLGFDDQRAGQRDPLLFASRETSRKPIGEVLAIELAHECPGSVSTFFERAPAWSQG